MSNDKLRRLREFVEDCHRDSEQDVDRSHAKQIGMRLAWRMVRVEIDGLLAEPDETATDAEIEVAIQRVACRDHEVHQAKQELRDVISRRLSAVEQERDCLSLRKEPDMTTTDKLRALREALDAIGPLPPWRLCFLKLIDALRNFAAAEPEPAPDQRELAICELEELRVWAVSQLLVNDMTRGTYNAVLVHTCDVIDARLAKLRGAD